MVSVIKHTHKEETVMNPEDFDNELPLDAEDWDEETLGLDVDDADTESLARELGVSSDY
jgi:hypothetical protein